MKFLKNKWIIAGVTLFFLVELSSCSPMDSFKKYTKGGEIVYTGKIDSLRFDSGRNRVLAKGLFIGDPKITQCRIYWNSGNDSVVVPVHRTNSVDTLHTLIDDLQENIYNFKVIDYDSLGNKSIPVYAIGTVYGKRYQASLNNRPIVSSQLYAGNLTTTTNFAEMDLTSGVFETEEKYTDNNNKQHVVKTSIDSSDVKLKYYKLGSKFQYRTLFLPDSTCIDTFYTNYQSVTPKVVYLLNTGNPFNYSIWDGSRWGVLADWTESPDVKNAENYTYGGYELRGGVGVLSLEAGWGIPAVPDGKIYQSPTLPAGTYNFQVLGIETGSNGTKYVSVAPGDSLPDVANVPSKSIAYEAISSSTGSSTTITFTLTQTTKVAIGFVGDMPDTGSYFKVHQVILTHIQ